MSGQCEKGIINRKGRRGEEKSVKQCIWGYHTEHGLIKKCMKMKINEYVYSFGWRESEMKYKSKIILAVLCFATCLMISPYGKTVQAAEAAAVTATPGTEQEIQYCGKTATWEYQSATKELHIKGTGLVEQQTEWKAFAIKKIVIEEGITKIGSDAFYSCSVQEVSLPDTLKEIGSYAFGHCSKLSEVNLPENLQKIGGRAFNYCSKLQKVTMNDKVTSIGYSTFYMCKSLTDITLSKSLRTLEDSTFYYCTSLKEIEIPQNVHRIGNSCFYNSGLESVKISNSWAICEGYSFAHCLRLKKVEFNGVSIWYDAFCNCNNLRDVNLGKNIRTIGSSAFYGTSLKYFVVPESVSKLGSNAFANCDELVKITFTKGVKRIPSYVVGYSDNLKTVVIEEGVKSIGYKAFCSAKMYEIKLPSSLDRIQMRAFEDAERLRSITISPKVQEIRYKTFKNCKSLRGVKLNQKVSYIGESAFENCDSLREISIPGNVKVIGYRAFYGSGVRRAELKEGVERIGYWAFQHCNKLTSVKISKTVTSLRNNSFVQCEKLTNIWVNPENQKYSSANGALYNKKQTKLINCPAGKKGSFKILKDVKKLSDYVFYECQNLKTFTVDPENKYYSVKNDILYNKSQTKLVCCPSGLRGTITVPAGVTNIKEYAFQYSKAKKIILPKGLQKIGYCAFEYCDNIEYMQIPGTVKTISSAAFWECDNLRYVSILSGVRNINSNAFHGCEKLHSVKIPASVKHINRTAFSKIYRSITIYCKKNSYAYAYADNHYMDSKII